MLKILFAALGVAASCNTLAHDLFDLQVCDAYPDTGARSACYRKLDPAGACRNADVAAEGACLRRAAASPASSSPSSRPPPQGQATANRPAAVAPLGDTEVCRAVIGAVMGRNPLAMSGVRTAGAEIQVSYVRPNDNSTFSYRCKLEGDRASWASPGSPWRSDSRIGFTVDQPARTVHVRESFPDGSANDKAFQF